jgi:sodium/potassium-transporting ATPase subunit alpha
MDLRAFWAAHPDFSTIFKECAITDSDGTLNDQCFDMSSLA